MELVITANVPGLPKEDAFVTGIRDLLRHCPCPTGHCEISVDASDLTHAGVRLPCGLTNFCVFPPDGGNRMHPVLLTVVSWVDQVLEQCPGTCAAK